MNRLADYSTGDSTNSFLSGLDVCDHQRIDRQRAEKAVRMTTRIDWDVHAALLLSARTYLSALCVLWRKARQGPLQKLVASLWLDSPVNARCCIVSRRSIRKHAAIMDASVATLQALLRKGKEEDRESDSWGSTARSKPVVFASRVVDCEQGKEQVRPNHLCFWTIGC
jgi:hypothetical protein